ncbi:MAG: endonuclease V [Candidatus Latescibacterota bacterium]
MGFRRTGATISKKPYPIEKQSGHWGKCTPFHSFGVSYQEAKQIQNELCEKVELVDTIDHAGEGILVGGADVAFISAEYHSSDQTEVFNEHSSSPEFCTRFQKLSGKNSPVTALAIVVTMENGKDSAVEVSKASAPVVYPYIPGLLSFREGPAVLAAIGGLQTLPHVMLYDGAGIAHPRGLGLASHMAVLTGIPSIGCAKSLLCGECSEPGTEKGDWTELRLGNHVVGACVRTRRGVKPIYISPGSGFTVQGAVEFVLSLSGKYRIPEPTRIAHTLVTAEKQRM